MRQTHYHWVAVCAVVISALWVTEGIAQNRLSDAALRIEVREELRSDARFRDVPIDFEVSGGVVTLTGVLPSYYERSRIERLCRSIRGVRRVNNRILVRPFDALDDQVEKAVKQRLRSDATTRSANVSVKVDDGVVTLSGNVATVRERYQAEVLVKQVRGIRGVRNYLSIQPEVVVASDGKAKPGPTDKEITDLLTSILKADPQLRSFPITFAVVDGVVTVEGEVVTPRQHFLIRVMAQRIPGVREVISHVVVNELIVPKSSQPDADLPPGKLAKEVEAIVSLMLDAETISDFAVVAGDGKIILRGKVASIFQKQQLLGQVRSLAQSMEIQDDLQVDPEPRDDSAVKADLAQLFKSDAVLGDEKISVSVSGGQVTLQGEVSLLIDKNRAMQMAMRVRGVQDLENQLEVKASSDLSDQDLVASLEAKLLRNRDIAEFADQLQISAKNGRVTLDGEIPTWALRGEVGRVAMQTDGVRSVANLISVKSPD